MTKFAELGRPNARPAPITTLPAAKLMSIAEEPESELYQRIGGEEGIDKLIDAFYVQVLDDEKLAPFFRHVDMTKLHHMQREFFSAALGGPITYTGRPIGHVHYGRGIDPHHIRRFVGHMFETLKSFDLTEAERDAIIDRINRYSAELLGDGGGLDG